MRIFASLGVCALFAASALAGPAAKPATRPAARQAPQGPVQIRSDKLKVQQKKRTAVFTGNVKTVQGELRIECRELTVRYAGEGSQAGSTGDVERMIFTGDVRIQQGDRRGHCERADYQRPAGRIVCTGKPWVIEGDNRIAGTRIIYLLDEDEVQVTQPRAVLTLPEDRKEQPVKGP